MVRTKSSPLDDAIHLVYAQFDDAIDDIVLSPTHAIEFAGKVRAQSAELKSLSDEGILRRAMALRKRGEDHGGLPRKQRKYGGRRPK